MFFVMLTVSLIILLTGIGLLTQGAMLVGWILTGVGVLCLLAIFLYYNSRKKWVKDCGDPLTCSSCTPDCDLPHPKGLDCDCMPDCSP